ncbi:MAG: hypothetical protein KDJ65_09295, partial [Anaerolineae bacterium]|nr:hypothetical protein [Anaerolineae bacterium]
LCFIEGHSFRSRARQSDWGVRSPTSVKADCRRPYVIGWNGDYMVGAMSMSTNRSFGAGYAMTLARPSGDGMVFGSSKATASGQGRGNRIGASHSTTTVRADCRRPYAIG